jgi:hypothetical protein
MTVGCENSLETSPSLAVSVFQKINSEHAGFQQLDFQPQLETSTKAIIICKIVLQFKIRIANGTELSTEELCDAPRHPL